MRPLIFLFPHARLDVGGNSAQVRFMQACAQGRTVETAYYAERVAGYSHLDDLLAGDRAASRQCTDAPIFVIHWGPDIAMLLGKLAGRDVIYVAHSTGWGMAMPPEVPILCVSRHTMAYWGRYAPNSHISLIPNVIESEGTVSSAERDIDVLVQTRKSSRYLMDRLVPALRANCRVHVLDGWVDDLDAWFRRSKVYLYDSLEHWVDVGATEGFGLPPLEAMRQGCIVFSSVNDALADYLDPGFNSRKLRVHSLAWDVAAVTRAISKSVPAPPPAEWFLTYSKSEVTARWNAVLEDLELFFAHAAWAAPDIEDIWALRRPTPLQRAKRAARLLAGR